MNLYNLPEPFEVVTFNVGNHEYNISTKYQSIALYLIGGGAGGGGGFTRSTGDGGGGGGGRPGIYGSYFLPAHSIPKKLSITVGSGGAGGAANTAGTNGGYTGVGTLGHSNRYDWINSVQGQTGSIAGAAGTATTGGAQGGSSGSGTGLYLPWVGFAFGTQTNNSASFNGIGTNNTINSDVEMSTSNSGRPNQQGTGGGGIVSGVGYPGNGISFSSAFVDFPGTVVPGGTTGTVGGDGANSWVTYTNTPYKIFPRSYGATGGGAGTVGAGGNGGNGLYGSGGGAGGSGNPGGAGGRGGDGLVILILW